jgi:hypothetical protein
VEYEDVTAVLENSYGDHHLAGAFHAQLRRAQHARESLQEFSAATDRLAHRAQLDMTEEHISKETA